jgi:hypothetical protein
MSQLKVITNLPAASRQSEVIFKDCFNRPEGLIRSDFLFGLLFLHFAKKWLHFGRKL